jgi:hypothetical protein
MRAEAYLTFSAHIHRPILAFWFHNRQAHFVFQFLPHTFDAK